MILLCLSEEFSPLLPVSFSLLRQPASSLLSSSTIYLSIRLSVFQVFSRRRPSVLRGREGGGPSSAATMHSLPFSWCFLSEEPHSAQFGFVSRCQTGEGRGGRRRRRRGTDARARSPSTPPPGKTKFGFERAGEGALGRSGGGGSGTGSGMAAAGNSGGFCRVAMPPPPPPPRRCLPPRPT